MLQTLINPELSSLTTRPTPETFRWTPLGSPDPLVVLLLIHPLDDLLGAFHQLSQGHLQVLEKRRRAWFLELLIVMMIMYGISRLMYIYVHITYSNVIIYIYCTTVDVYKGREGEM